MICVEIYEIKTPFTSVSLARFVKPKGCENFSDEITHKAKVIPLIKTYPADEGDLSIVYRKDYPTDFAIFSAGLFIGRVLGYPKGEYQLNTPYGLKTLVISDENGTPRLYINRPARILEYFSRIGADRISFYDGESDGKCYRIVLCDNVMHFDIQSAGASLLRFHTGGVNPAGLCAISGKSGIFSIRVRCNDLPELSCYDPHMFKVLGEVLSRTEGDNYRVIVETPLGKIVIVSEYGKFYIAAVNPSVARIYG